MMTPSASVIRMDPMKIPKTELVKFAKDAFHNASEFKSKLSDEEVRSFQGMSGLKGRHFLNNLCSIPGTRYLEIGLWKGSTFRSALRGNSVIATGIDNWSEFNGPMEECVANIKKEVGANTVQIIDSDCFVVDKTKLTGPYDVYFYDGGHSATDQYRALTYYTDVLADDFILVVDDWMQLEVQRGTLFSLRDLDYNVLWENHCRSIDNDPLNWWCGMYVAVVSKK